VVQVRSVDAVFRRRIDKIFLMHIWVCVPFSRLWQLWYPSKTPLEAVHTLRILVFASTAYLLLRTAVVYRAGNPAPWRSVWPVFDVVFVTAIIATMGEPTSPFALMYMVPIAYAAFNLSLTAAFSTGAFAGIGYFAAGTVSGGWASHEWGSVAFRSLFPLLMASLIGFVGREAARLRERLALTEYQRDLAAEMHDGIQHDLVLIARRLDLADALRETDPARAAALAVEQREVARRASDEIRTLVRGLRSGSQASAGFLHSLREHVEGIARSGGVEVSFSSEGGPDVPPRCQHTLLRIIQEATTNALKHSGATHIRVHVAVASDRCDAVIEDNGRGFDTSAPAAGAGLETMRTRAAAAGGECRIESAPGRGTRVMLALPAGHRERRTVVRGTHSD
jgi:signal transduction histidine kinase